MLIVRSPVRISFVGGGTDLPAFYEQHGGAVISVSINKYFYTVLTERDDRMVQLISSDLRVMQTVDDISLVKVEGELRIPMAVIQHLGCSRGLNLFLASEITPGTGLGSSGSVCVNLVKSIGRFTGREYDKYALAETAYYVSSRMLGHPGGKQDEYGVAFGGLKHVEFQRDGSVTVTPLALDRATLRQLERNTMLFFTGSSRQSAEILNEQKQSSERGQTGVINALTGLKELVADAQAALTAGEIEQFGRVLHRGWLLKKQVSAKISNPRIDGLYEEAVRAGALGGKITGAGGGGFLMIFCEEEHQQAVRDLLVRDAGLQEMTFQFDYHGTSIIYDDPFIESKATGGMYAWKFIKSES